jgi:hypothetical protein
VLGIEIGDTDRVRVKEQWSKPDHTLANYLSRYPLLLTYVGAPQWYLYKRKKEVTSNTKGASSIRVGKPCQCRERMIKSTS